MNCRHILVLVGTTLPLLLACEASPAKREQQLCKTWTLQAASFTDRAEFVAFAKQKFLEVAKAKGASIDATQAGVQRLESDINDAMLTSLKGSRMKLTPDYAVTLSGPGQAPPSVFGKWLLKAKALTITVDGADSTYEIVSLSDSQLVLSIHGLTQTNVAKE